MTDQYDGSTDPFEGDRTIVWRSLPSNAKVTKATITTTPVAPVGGTLFEEVISFSGSQGGFGATKNKGAGFVEIDFHKRRTLASVDGTNIRALPPATGANLQVDLGGLYVEINDKGAIRAPGDTLFNVPSDGSLPGLTASKFKLTATNPDVNSVTIRSAPSNVTVKIGTLAAFYSHTGDLSTADMSADFSAVLQTFLAHSEVVNGFFVVPLVIHSDTVARLRIDLTAEFVSQASLQPEGIKEVVVPFDFSTLPQTEANVLSVALPPNASVLPGQTSAKAVGAFNDTRIAHGAPAGTAPPPFAVEVSPNESQGQLISPADAVAAKAVDVLVSALTLGANLTLDLRGDLGGRPDGNSLIHKPVPFEIKSAVSGEPEWVSVALPGEFKFAGKGALYWLVLSSLEGTALWSTQPGAAGSPGVQHTLDGAFSWHYAGALGASGPLDASFRLRNKPPIFEVPIALRVGTGDKAALVSLDRFQPASKVDFTIDTPDFSEAFNQYLSAVVPQGCPQGEHLLNGNFEQWAAPGGQIGTPFSLTGLPAAAVVTSADGRWAYVAGQGGNQPPEIGIIDVICDEFLSKAIQLPAADFLSGIAINLVGNRLYVVSPNNLCVADAATNSAIGAALPASAISSASNQATASTFQGLIVVSPGGGSLYATFGTSSTSIISIDTGALEQAVRGLRPLAAGDIRVLDLQGTAVAMALSPDGTTVYIALSGNNAIAVIDTQSFTIGSRIDVASQPEAIDFTPDGKFAVVLTSGDFILLHLVETATGRDLDSFVIGSDAPVAVAVSPDGAVAYAVLSPSSDLSATESQTEAAQILVPINLQLKLPGTQIPIPGTGTEIAITPQGDRIYIAGDGPVVIVPVGTRSPADWFVTSDTPSVQAQVVPFCVPRPSPVDVAVVFGQSAVSFQPNGVATGLSQVVPVAGPCSYELSFFGSASEPGALAEIFWLDQQGTLLQTDSLPIQVQPEAGLSLSSEDAAPLSELLMHRTRVRSPANAAQAELRFSAPPFVGVALGLGSLQGTPEALSNSDLQFVQNGLPVGWTLTAQFLRGVTVSSIDGGTRFVNASAGDAELVQSAAIGANQAYIWELEGRPANLATAQEDPSIELRWLKSDASVAGTPAELTLSAGGFVRNPASGTTPDGTTTVEVRLKAPPGTGFNINQVSLQTPETTTVPLTFISQAPGELRVSRSQVTYDVVPVPPPPVPSQGLATPTAPGSKPGDPPCNTYCPSCQDDRPVMQPQPAMTRGRRPAIVGECPVCGSRLVRPGGPLASGAQVLAATLLPPARHRDAGMRVPRKQPPALPPLTALPGIRAGRMRQLAEIGITSIEHLARANPDETAKAMVGLSPKQAASLIEKAKELMASHRRYAMTARSDAPPSQPSPPQGEQKE